MVSSAPALHTHHPGHRPLPQLAGPQVLQAQLVGSDKEWNKEELVEKHEGVTQSRTVDMPVGKGVLPRRSNERNAEEQQRSLTLLWFLALAFMVLLYGSYGVLMNLSKVDNRIPFSSSALYFFIETFKFMVAGLLLRLETWGGGGMTSIKISLRRALPFAVPAVLYSINNNLAVFMQVHMDPATYHMLGNLKIVTTAVLYRIMLKRALTLQQWISIGLLTVAGVCDSVSHIVGKADIHLTQQYITVVGLLTMLTYCLISALAGVYTEFILKRDLHTSLHLQNMMLYSFSILLNFTAWTFTHEPGEGSAFQILRGFSVYTWLIVLTQVINGLGMSVVFKLGSNLVRLFVVSCAMVVSTALSMLVLGLRLNPLFFLTLLLIILAIYLYHH